MASVALSGCASSGSDKEKGFPSGFDSLDDVSKVAYVIENATPDSVARFLCEASLGHVAEARIDTLALAAAFAYEHYNDSALIAFSQEFDSYSANLPLADKMRIYSLPALPIRSASAMSWVLSTSAISASRRWTWPT